MAYRLTSDESLSAGVKRIATEQIDSSIYRLTTSIKADRAKAIHSARKHFKKLRALMRLVRDEVGHDRYKPENVCFRDAGRQLSEVRDAQVRIETLDDLIEHYRASLDVHQFEGIRQILVKTYERSRDEATPDKKAIATLTDHLNAANDRIQTWPISDDWSAIEGSLHRVYRRGHAGFLKACNQATPEHLHDWRKRVKYLWYHLRLLTPLWPSVVKATKTQIKVLSDLLGDDHDLTVLRAFIMDDPETFDADDQLGVLLALIQRRQLELQIQARFLGQRVYADGADAFVARLEQYWWAWEGERSQPPIVLPSTSDTVHDLPTATLQS